MKIYRIPTAVRFPALLPTVQAEPDGSVWPVGAPRPPVFRQRVLEQFDAGKDGSLAAEERPASPPKASPKAQKPPTAKAEEKHQIRHRKAAKLRHRTAVLRLVARHQALQKAFLIRFDANNDRQLSKPERAHARAALHPWLAE